MYKLVFSGLFLGPGTQTICGVSDLLGLLEEPVQNFADCFQTGWNSAPVP